MNLADYPYKGTLDELRQVHSEIRELQAERAHLDQQERVLQEHRACILRLLAEQ